MTRTRHREIGLVVPTKFVFLRDDQKCCETLENQLTKKRNIFPARPFKIQKKMYIENFRFTK